MSGAITNADFSLALPWGIFIYGPYWEKHLACVWPMVVAALAVLAVFGALVIGQGGGDED
jgi:hypothetical protein